MNTIPYLTTILLICLSSLSSLCLNTLSESTFYCVSNTSPNLLYTNDPQSNSWTIVGETGTTNLKALAFNNETNTLYGINEGVLGTVNLQTGAFNAYGTVSLGDGAFGEIILNNIEALTYDPFSKLLFAIHRISGQGESTNDLFFKIDPLTGSIVKDAVFDYKERRFDYVPIPEILREGTSVKDILGLTVNPQNFDLIALHSQNGYSSISKIHKRTGEIEEILYNSYAPFSDIAYDEAGNLYATIGDRNDAESSILMYINTEVGTESLVSTMSDTNLNFQSLTSTGVNMQALDNDLALRLNLSPDYENPLTQGSIVSFDLTIFNQGELAVNEVRLSVEINESNFEVLDLGIYQSNWIKFGNRIYGSFKNAIKPGEDFTESFRVQLNDNFKGTMVLNSEIQHAYNHNITNEIGKLRPLSDIDSNYDNVNNEISVVNDEINGGGITANEDEDDHDIMMIEVERANNLIFSPCYTVSSQENAPNVLFEFNPETGKWTEVGITGGSSIEAIATDPVNDLIYATDGGTFGIIDKNTGKFTPYRAVGTGDGAYGSILMDNIKGLTYDPVNEIMYAVHRISGEGPGTNDLFFKIDVSTGGIIPVAMQDPDTGSPVDYVIIPEVLPPTEQDGEFYDVDDIAYIPYTGQLFAIQNQKGLLGANITEINPVNGELESVIFDMESENDLEGIGFTSLGELYGTQGDMGLIDEESNNFIKINLAEATIANLGKIDPDDGVHPLGQVDFEAFDCFTAYNDLALKMEVDASVQQPIDAGNPVTFIINVFNQGKFANTDINIINYIPSGLILSDTKWTDLGNGTAIYIHNKSIEPGASFEVPISFIINANFEEESITNTAEIVASFNPQIYDPNGNPIPLPDWDSFPDDWNNELLVTDNDINSGGPNANEDEDDHDIAIVEIAEVIVIPTPYNTLTKFNCYAVSEDNAAPNVLFEYNPETNKWTEIGITGGTYIEAIATDPISGIIYATDAGQFGTIDANTAAFTPIGTGVGIALTGAYDNLLLDDIDGLTYDPINEIMYATHRIGGTGSGTEDVLFQIDVSTGSFVPNAMINPITGNAVDYAIIPAIPGSTLKKANNYEYELYDVDDIAYNPYTGQLFANQNQDAPGAITELNPSTGELEQVIYDYPNDDVEGVGFNYLGQLYGTTGDNGICDPNNPADDTCLNTLIYIDLVNGNTVTIGKIDPTGEQVDFEAFDCFTAYNDLALKIEVGESTEQPVLAGQTVDFIITIYNQGDFNSSDITLTNYIPNGLELNDVLWTDMTNGTATFTLNETLEPGTSTTTYVSFKVAEGVEGEILTNAVEISASFSPEVEEFIGYPVPLPDLDSYPDDVNNETDIVNNQIDGKGPNAIQNNDEDDHDIALVKVASEQGEACLIEFNDTDDSPQIPSNQNWASYEVLTDFPCYAVSSGNASNALFEYNPSTNEWTQVGITGGTQIDAIATDPVTDIIYAADGGTFGIIDANTALFTPIGEVGSGNGDAGLVELNDVDGLSFDPVNQIMYATHRVPSGSEGTNDLLFQIDVATGQVVSGAMLNKDKNPVDYTVIQEIPYNTGECCLYDVSDIAYHTYTGRLFANQNQDGPGALTELNPSTGALEQVIFDYAADGVEGIGFTYFGALYGSTGNSGICHPANPADDTCLNTFIYLDLANGNTTSLGKIDPTGEQVDFEAFDCFTAYNDLALKMEVDPNIQQPVNIGESVSFLITIYNQGDFSNSDITITNYIPSGLCLVDKNWGILDDGKVFYTLPEVLEPGDSTTISINFTVNENFNGQNITNTAEISVSFSLDIAEIIGVSAAPLPDIDSQSDAENNEINVTDNDINGGGPKSINNEDEDDHDIAVLQVNNLSANITINPELCDALGSVQVEIELAVAPPYNYEWRDANGNIIDEHTSIYSIHQIPGLTSGTYTLMVSDALNQMSTFEVVVPLLSELDGNSTCDNNCPSYLIAPEGEIYGSFKAKEVVEIKGCVDKTKTAVFDICK